MIWFTTSSSASSLRRSAKVSRSRGRGSRCRPRAAPLVIASDPLPVSASLYQAAKIAAAAAQFVEPQGVIIIVAECADGIGPIDIVNEAIFRIGVLPRLPPGVRLVLISSRPRE